VALEENHVTAGDLEVLLDSLLERPAPRVSESEIVLLEGGYWLHRNEIAAEGPCRCERQHCAGSERKMYCYFRPDLSQWVTRKGLYHKCYDELIDCPRCHMRHKRGHVGRLSDCGVPFRNQELQTDG
jgi:hypothetical protein